MYEAFYGFREKPFSMLPDPGFLFLSKKHQTALTLLEYGLLNHVGFCVISGEPGAGKTTILRALLDRIGDDVTVGLITNTHQSFGGLLDWVLSAFDLHRPNMTHVEMHQVFMEFLIEEYGKGRTTLLIVDEAQNMQPDALEELRMLSNVNTEKDQLMQVVLAGQPALKEMLRLPDLMQFAQRIAVDYHLDPLSLEETCGYIQHRLVTAGAQKDVFTPAACERIYNYSGGTPRLINLLCETVLVYGFADQLEMIDVGLVDEMVLERMKDSVVPIVNRDVANQGNSEASKALEKNFPWIQSPDGSPNLTTEADTISRVADSAEEPVTPAIVDVALAEAMEAEPSINEKPEDGARQDESLARQETKPEKQASEEVSPSPVSPVAPRSASEAGSAVRNDDRNINQADTDNRRQLIKYGVIAVLLAVALVVLALVLDVEEPVTESEVVTDQPTEEALQRQRELEEQKFRQLQIEAETLKKERDAAIAKAEAEKLANLEAAKKAATAAALAAEEVAEKTRQEELQRVEAAKQREREAKAAEARAKRAAESARLEAEKLAEQQRVMRIRLEEEAQLKKLEEARRKELEAQRLEALAAEEQAIQAAEKAAAQEAEVAAEEAALKAAEDARSKPADCTGPTARFKSGCR